MGNDEPVRARLAGVEPRAAAAAAAGARPRPRRVRRRLRGDLAGRFAVLQPQPGRVAPAGAAVPARSRWPRWPSSPRWSARPSTASTVARSSSAAVCYLLRAAACIALGVLAVPADLLPVRRRPADDQQGVRRGQAGAGPAGHRRPARARRRPTPAWPESAACSAAPVRSIGGVVFRWFGAPWVLGRRRAVLHRRGRRRSAGCTRRDARPIVPEDVEYAETHLPTIVVASIGFMAIRGPSGFFVFTHGVHAAAQQRTAVGLRRRRRRLRHRRVRRQRDHPDAAPALPGADAADDGHRRAGVARARRHPRRVAPAAARRRRARRPVDDARPPRVRRAAAVARAGGAGVVAPARATRPGSRSPTSPAPWRPRRSACRPTASMAVLSLIYIPTLVDLRPRLRQRPAGGAQHGRRVAAVGVRAPDHRRGAGPRRRRACRGRRVVRRRRPRPARRPDASAAPSSAPSSTSCAPPRSATTVAQRRGRRAGDRPRPARCSPGRSYGRRRDLGALLVGGHASPRGAARRRARGRR